MRRAGLLFSLLYNVLRRLKESFLSLKKNDKIFIEIKNFLLFYLIIAKIYYIIKMDRDMGARFFCLGKSDGALN